MADLEVIQVIHTRLFRRGDGIKTYVRIIDQYWDMTGNLLWEFDPCPNDSVSDIEESRHD